MTKKEVQQRVLQKGKPLALRKFSWCEKTRTFSTRESNLILDFDGIDFCNFNTGYGCNFNTRSHCTFKTSYGCIFKTEACCIFKTESCCTFKTGWGCNFDTRSCCVFNTSFGCNFDTGNHCIFNIWVNGSFVNKSENNVVVVRYANFTKIYDLDLLEKDKVIELSFDNKPLVE